MKVGDRSLQGRNVIASREGGWGRQPRAWLPVVIASATTWGLSPPCIVHQEQLPLGLWR